MVAAVINMLVVSLFLWYTNMNLSKSKFGLICSRPNRRFYGFNSLGEVLEFLVSEKGLALPLGLPFLKRTIKDPEKWVFDGQGNPFVFNFDYAFWAFNLYVMSDCPTRRKQQNLF